MMELSDLARVAHIVAGVVVLVSFWRTALAPKGGPAHRRFGRIYLVAMSALLALTLVLAAGFATGGQGMRAVFNVYVTLISVVSVWMAWRSIADRDDVDAYRGWVCKTLCALLGGYGLFLLAMVPRMGEPARMAMVSAFALLGLVVAGSLLHRIVRGADHPQWWLGEHLSAMALNFAATHASFTILGLSSLLPVVREPWARTIILCSWMMAALVARLVAGRRFMRRPRRAVLEQAA
jgi:hypothetical protein